MARCRFVLVDGRRRDMDVGRAWVAIDADSEVTLVVFDDDAAASLLCAYSQVG